MIRLDGKAVASARESLLRERIERFVKSRGRKPGLAVVIVGDDPASHVYVKIKVKMTGELGMSSTHIELPESVSEAELLKTVEKLNQDPTVDGILVQLPLPKTINSVKVIDSIDPQKDPDGLTSANLGLLFAGRPRVAPCTPLGVMAIFEHYKIPVAGKRAVVIGRSQIVGKPMAQLLTNADATVTLCHSRTKDLAHHVKDAELVVVAAGKQRLLGKEAFSKGVVIVDVGMHRSESGAFAGKLTGDVKFEEIEEIASAATPVPGGVGPMTIQMLMENTVTLAEKRS